MEFFENIWEGGPGIGLRIHFNFFLGPHNIAATGDFRQKNLGGIQASGVEGYLLADWSFIFTWWDGYRKMVLTDNKGFFMKAGYHGIYLFKAFYLFMFYVKRAKPEFKISKVSQIKSVES